MSTQAGQAYLPRNVWCDVLIRWCTKQNAVAKQSVCMLLPPIISELHFEHVPCYEVMVICRVQKFFEVVYS